MLPKRLRVELEKTYQPGLPQHLNPSPRYVNAAMEARRFALRQDLP
jgi:hypothetical protein